MNAKRLSEKETVLDCQSSIMLLTSSIKRTNTQIQDVGDYLPGSVMIQDFQKMTNMYMNKAGCDILKMSSEELYGLGPDYFIRFFPEEEMKLLRPQMEGFIREDDTAKATSFFQRVRAAEHEDYRWYLTTSRLLPSEPPFGGKSLMHIAVDVGSLAQASRLISFLHDDDVYFRSHYQKLCLLSKREKEIIGLIANGRSSYEISDVLYISIHTVNNHRKNILAKLQIKSISALVKFAFCFDLV